MTSAAIKRPPFAGLFVGLAAVLSCACSPVQSAEQFAPAATAEQSADQPERHSESGLPLIEVTVVRGERRIVFETEVADTPQAQARGMMFRTEMGDDEAMLFPSERPAQRNFWMKNTPLPLDIIFIGVDGRISNIERGVPYELESVGSDGLASAVLEIRGGLSAELGIVAGDRVEYDWPQ
ncbi:hypothetical protein Ga0102493_11504 [Erythrobacter litoralis]|jgi:uncharacterized membrane protein (UPF0127 family)|uniref:DUF192 domain-containing protein n=1 Tax=Erythrobacter litoralis TaxID=39960 RepID=A0A074MUN5_9SPHN|nr:DUF192 domain-containing protein [Erythrobacter litoralis]AOL24636.1 hypothetical protein Ga0102493_11504 [Erythrobacter litoralis]KEO89332.1 hypothetical protein EH32_04170 [Erythrobacter litoralis]MEE4337698.1 DUF192 domain-containing protein [Erythrobacter sp.]